MRLPPTEIPGVVIIEPDVYRDQRGFFLETYHTEKYREAGIPGPFVQDNHSRSLKAAARLHLQSSVRKVSWCGSSRAIFDVAVDVRRGSPTFGKWMGVTLSAENFRQCYLRRVCTRLRGRQRSCPGR